MPGSGAGGAAPSQKPNRIGTSNVTLVCASRCFGTLSHFVCFA